MATDAMERDGLERDVLERVAERVGTPAMIAEAARAHRPPEPFVRRFRWLVFPLAPLPLLLVAAFLYGLAIAGLLTLWADDSTVGTDVPQAFLIAVQGFLYVPSTLVAVMFAWLAARSRLRISWWLAAVALPLYVTSHLVVATNLSSVAGASSLSLGLTIDPTLGNVAQWIVPLTIGLLAFVAVRRRVLRYG